MKNLTLLILSFLVLYGCEQTSAPVAPSESTSNAGNIAFTFDKVNAPAAVKTLTATLTRSGYTTLTKTLNIATDTTATMLFTEVVIGTWKVKVDAKDESGKVLYAGEADVLVLEGTVTQVNLTLTPVPTGVGSVQINVTWGIVPSPWADYDHNPILTTSKSIYENVGVSQPRVYKFGTKYHMYYQMIGEISSVGLAISNDGNTWTREDSTPVLYPNPQSWDDGGIVPGPVFPIENLYVMFYQAFSKNSGSLYVGIAKSTDGKVWYRQNDNRLQVDGAYIYHASEVILKDSTFYMYYLENPLISHSIFLATSKDGVNWKKHGQNPVLKKSLDWEITGVYFNSIVYENNVYKTVYSDAGFLTANFGFATSVDGITWKKETTPIFTYKSTHNQWANAGISYPMLTKVENQLRIYYMGASGLNYVRKIGFAYMK